ncbi:MAG: SIMPL domain-containing protein [Candidatus Polarisedimenticolia bacterium]
MSVRGEGETARLGMAAILAAGMALAGWFVGHGFLKARSADRNVSVNGLAEREVPADLVLWPLVFSVTANDLETLHQRAESGIGKVRAFLQKDFEGEEVTVSAPQVTDREGQGGPAGRPLERYAAEITVSLRTSRIDKVRPAMAASSELVKQGVALIRSYEQRTQYMFTGLDRIKPEMIAEATRDARRAAQQFAEDSGSRVGSIRSARQGYFSIEDRDPFSPEIKKVRVVTTVQYALDE